LEDESITGALSFDDFEAIGDGLIHHGWAVLPSFLPAATALALAAEAQAHWQAGAFRQAGVGRGAGWVQRPDIRSDEVFWVEGEDLSPTLATTLGKLDALKQHLNRSLFAGLEDFEVHLARYGRGACPQAPRLPISRSGPKRAPWWYSEVPTSGTRCGERGEPACR
jgi:hypothetical protein